MKAYGSIAPLQIQTIRAFNGVDNRSLFNIEDTKANLQRNMTCDEFPALATRQAFTQLGTGTIAGQSRGLGAWKNSELNTIYNDGVWYKWTGSAWSSVTTGLSTSAYASFCNFQGNLASIHLLMANGVDAVKKYDGTSVSNLANAPASIAFIDAHDNRVYGAAGNTIYYSGLRKPEDWTTVNDAGSIVVESQDGETINSIRSGLQKLTVFKPNSMYELYGTGPSNYRLVTVAENIGILNHRCSTVINGVMYFLHKNGLYRYAGGSRPDKDFCAPVQNIINGSTDASVATQSCIGDDGQSVFVHLRGSNSVLGLSNIVLQYHTVYDIWTVYGDMTYYPQDFENVNGTLYASCNFNVITFKGGTAATQDSQAGTTFSITSTHTTKAFSGPFLGSKNRFMRVFVTHNSPAASTLTVEASTGGSWTSIGTITGTGSMITSRIMVPQTLALQNSSYIQLRFSNSSRYKIFQYGFEYLEKPLV